MHIGEKEIHAKTVRLGNLLQEHSVLESLLLF